MLSKTKNHLLTLFFFISIIILTGCPNMPDEFTANIPPTLSFPSRSNDIKWITNCYWHRYAERA